MKYLEAGDSISHALVNLLTALALMNNGVREILPFVRYISQFVDFEWNAIKAQDKGKGVVCAATWIMPAALVPRPWDFPDPPKSAQSGSIPASGHSKAPAPGPGFDNIVVPPASVPALVVTPPSVIRDTSASAL